MGSVQFETDFYADEDRYRMAIFHGRLELPLFDGGDGFFIKSQSDAAGDSNITRMSIGVDDQPQNARALIFCLAGGLGVFGIGCGDRARGRDTSANAEYASA